MNFAAFGRTKWLYDGILACVERGHRVSLIGTSPASPEYTVGPKEFQKLAQRFRCPFFNDPGINKPDQIELARECDADIAISVNWLTILRAEMLSQFPLGVVNAHAGDLPRFRGNAAPNWAMLLGEEHVVATLHRMSTELDAGEILKQRKFPLTSQKYIGDVYRFLNHNFPQMFVELLDDFERGRVTPRSQPPDPALSLRCFPRQPGDGLIDWRQPAIEIANLVRVSGDPFPGAYSFYNGEKLIVRRAESAEHDSPQVGIPGHVVQIQRATGKVAVLTGEGMLLIEQVEIGTQGKRPAAEILRSTRVRLGMAIEEEIHQLLHRVNDLERQLQAVMDPLRTSQVS